MALNQEKYLDDFTWTELNDVINFIRKAEGSASDHSYALQLLEINFKANPLDLIYHLTAGSMMKHCFMPG
jgi:hypothetical protein